MPFDKPLPRRSHADLLAALAELEPASLPRCVECNEPDDNLGPEGLCRECEDYCIDTSVWAMRQEHGTY